MDQFGMDLEKALKAGIGAVKSGADNCKANIERWAEKGEPIYEAAKATLCDAAGKIKKHMEEKPCRDRGEQKADTLFVEDIKQALQKMDKKALDDIQHFIGQIYLEAMEGHDTQADGHQNQCEKAGDEPHRKADEAMHAPARSMRLTDGAPSPAPHP